GIDHFISTIWEIGSLRSRNADLEVDNALLRAELGELKEIREENAALRQQVGVEMTMGWNLNLVRVLGIDIQRFAGYVLIDAGRDENIGVGDAVVLGNILIGEVRDVYKSTSRVRLVSNQNSNIMGVAQETRAKGLVHGSLDGIVMEEVLENEELKKGDLVVTWQDDIPDNLVIGEIIEIDDNPTASTKSARLESGLDLGALDYVFVVMDY
ncbi:MAG: rod shape-determining protein MreC, partial [Patescibacteria group bacterium]|nr:rod shape-determining protein MreC [Patescibacteria group bacterium]